MVRLLQAGRAGRSGRKALTIMVAWDSPLEQHFVRHPNDMLQRPIEVQSSACCGKPSFTSTYGECLLNAQQAAVLNNDNEHIAASQAECAAAELPLCDCDAHVLGPTVLQHAQAEHKHTHDRARFTAVQRRATGWSEQLPVRQARIVCSTCTQVWRLVAQGGHSSNPASAVSLRSIAQERFRVLDMGANLACLEELEPFKAIYRVTVACCHDTPLIDLCLLFADVLGCLVAGGRHR